MEYIRKVNYYETDNMGVVHHSNYIRYFEEARIDILDRLNLGYSEIERQGIFIPVLECECKYIKSASFGMCLIIETEITAFDGIRMEMEYTVKDEQSRAILAKGKTKHCFLNKSFKPVRLKKNYPDIYNALYNFYTEGK